VDIHCHCLSDVDDGPGDLDESLALCRALVADGITTVVATPHQLGRYEGRNGAAAVRAAVEELNRAVAAEGLPLSVLPGADVRIDERIPLLLSRDQILTVGDGGRYLLLELPSEAWIDPVALVRELASMQVTTILTHPERHPRLSRQPDHVLRWRAEGIVLQLTAGSLLGRFGRSAEQACWTWLRRGAADLIASDAHDVANRRPCLSAAFAAVARRLGPDGAGRVCIDNPQRVLRGRELLGPQTETHRRMRA
jgi:protein-tyrosine phosphatase